MSSRQCLRRLAASGVTLISRVRRQIAKEGPMEKIVAGVDGSPSSLQAVALAADLANKYGAELVLVTVARELTPAMTAELEGYLRQEHIDVPVGELY